MCDMHVCVMRHGHVELKYPVSFLNHVVIPKPSPVLILFNASNKKIKQQLNLEGLIQSPKSQRYLYIYTCIWFFFDENIYIWFLTFLIIQL